ncbi:MAG: hypothetical protein OEZ34_01855 [Spirochaetia bacterium]|nr:hypothetical protein [Spirochaetia bacterium]
MEISEFIARTISIIYLSAGIAGAVFPGLIPAISFPFLKSRFWSIPMILFGLVFFYFGIIIS